MGNFCSSKTKRLKENAISRKEFSTGIFVCPEYWRKEEQKVLDPGVNSKTINSQLSLIKQKLDQALPMTQKILDKYPYELKDDRVLPSKINAHFNVYLKEIADLCELKINLTHHIAKKTFATTVLLLNDVPMEIVSKFLGHSRIGITQAHYGLILEEKVQEEIIKLAEKLK